MLNTDHTMVTCTKHRWRLEKEITDKTVNPKQKCLRCNEVQPAKKEDLLGERWETEYQMIHEKINTLDRITFELRVTFIGGLSFLTGSTGLLSSEFINLPTVEVGGHSFPIHIFFSIIGLILVAAAAIFDIHYRHVLYTLEQRGKLIEYFHNFDTIRRISKKSEWKDYQKWSFVIFYGILAVILVLILYWSIPSIQPIQT